MVSDGCHFLFLATISNRIFNLIYDIIIILGKVIYRLLFLHKKGDVEKYLKGTKQEWSKEKRSETKKKLYMPLEM
jgi:hypothetical protein